MTTAFTEHDGVEIEDQKPASWNPALRPDSDRVLPHQQPIISATDCISRADSSQQVHVNAARTSPIDEGLDAGQSSIVNNQGTVAPSDLVHTIRNDDVRKEASTSPTDNSSLQSKPDIAPGPRSLTTNINGSSPQPSNPVPSVESNEPAMTNLTSSEQHDVSESLMDSEEADERPWLLHRNPTDLGTLLDGVQRTSTFPEPMKKRDPFNGAGEEAPLPGSQVESIMREDEVELSPRLSPELQQFQNDDSYLSSFSASGDKANGHEFPPLESSAQGGYSYEPEPDQEKARFEEGLPLVQPHTDTEHVKKDDRSHRDTLNSIFSPSGDDGNEDFFNQTTMPVDTTASPIEHRSLQRKTTSEVVATLRPSQTANEESDDFRDISTGKEQQAPDISKEKGWTGAENVPEGDAGDQWQAMLEDDNEFLIEDADDLLSDSEAESSSSSFDKMQKDRPKSVPDQANLEPQPSVQAAVRPTASIRSSSNPYAPHQPSSSDLAQGLPGSSWANVGSLQGRPPAAAVESNVLGQQRRPQAVERAESFADQNKGGYKSPYDLPMDLTKPRKRPQPSRPAVAPASNKPPPPPRSSSIMSNTSASSVPGRSPLSPTNEGPPPSYRPQSAGMNTGTASANGPQHSNKKSTSSSSSFFEELPTSTRSRAPATQGRYTPQTPGLSSGPTPRSPSRPTAPLRAQLPTHQAPQTHSTDPYAQFQLQKPARLDPFPSAPLQPTPELPTSAHYSPSPPNQQTTSRPVATSRYSPAPSAALANAPPRNRYASQPNTTSMPPPPSLPFQPRTSSPLAHHEQGQHQRSSHNENELGMLPTGPPTAGSEILSRIPGSQLPRSGYFREGETVDPVASSMKAGVPNSPPMTLDQSRSRNANLPTAPQYFAPPKRSQTSSPGRRDARLSQYALPDGHSVQRPVSAHGQTSPVKSGDQSADHSARPSVRQRGLTQNFAFIPPQDEQQFDTLQRWRGSPIFNFGFGGSIVTSFPRHVPRYVAGQVTPMIKPSGGSIKIESAKGTLPFVESLNKFPGPLRSKSKKKDLLAWLSDRIAAFQYDLPRIVEIQQLPDPKKRLEEKIVLWKLVKTIAEFDGIIEGKPEALNTVSLIISPELEAQEKMSEAMYGPGSNLSGIYQPVGTTHQSQPVNVSAVELIRKNLLHGNRERAVWDAVDAGLWSHAMLIASTLEKHIWRQVVQEFVRQEVKTAGNNTESLASLYEIFAGNLDESVDELVPPSARAGLQMVSKVSSAGPTKNALEGLDRWRETLTLVLNNRSPNDHQALATLGRLLASYGRVEAAHSCFLFSRALNLPSVFGATDDPQASIVLLGADHRLGVDISLDEDAILLTEAYEFATTLLPTNAAASTAMPHLQAFKLQHAFMLAENGLRSEAQQYCDAIAGSLKATTKSSPYHHVQFFAQLDDLTKRLQQAPIDGSSSWISKPSMEKVSGSMWNKFSNFIAGDESDAASTGSGKDASHDFGPFAKMSGTPTISRAPSVSDFQNAYPAAPGGVPSNGAASRYAPPAQHAPNNQYAPRSSSELQGSRISLDSQRSPSYISSQLQGSPSLDSGAFSQPTYQQPYTPSPYQPTTQSPPQNQYQATPPQSSYTPSQKIEGQQQPSYSSGSYMPTPPLDQAPIQSQSSSPATSYPFQSIPPTEDNPDVNTRNAPAGFGNDLLTSNAPQTGSETELPPPNNEQQSYSSYGGYDQYAPSTYTPYVPEPESPEPQPRSPPKPQAVPSAETSEPNPSLTASARAQRDREVDEAFRKAAEADAARDKKPGPGDKTVKPKSSWLGSWFKGNTDDLNKGSDSASGGKIVRAKLGEESSFYYDPDLKKWVNRKDPNSATASARATPPPPRAAPNRSVSGLGPPSAPISRLASSPSMPILNASGPSPSSRPETPVSRTSSPAGEAAAPAATSDVVGLAPRPGPPVSRPSSTMSNASNIDDLLGGPPQARKAGGTLRGKKKGRGYVDVMAK